MILFVGLCTAYCGFHAGFSLAALLVSENVRNGSGQVPKEFASKTGCRLRVSRSYCSLFYMFIYGVLALAIVTSDRLSWSISKVLIAWLLVRSFG
jgi:hypothetical protein